MIEAKVDGLRARGEHFWRRLSTPVEGTLLKVVAGVTIFGASKALIEHPWTVIAAMVLGLVIWIADSVEKRYEKASNEICD
jgi:undecaprenyl pyrophosphate phosphatase UppP